MNDDQASTTGEAAAAEGALEAGEAPEESAGAKTEERGRVDEDGLPLDRAPTIDDVRSKEARHGRFALGCTVLIVLLILAFWAIRAGLVG